ncbi:MAG: hypothetical protein NWE96_10530 [Candidatus Bathyarchaeota archaeon]|nr:hypothetical protein [Candidatus Bathyarchaeota archaeon]
MSVIEKKTAELTRHVTLEKMSKETENEFVFISGIERFTHLLDKCAFNAHTIDWILVLDHFSFQIADKLKERERKYRDDVKIRIVTSSPENLSPLKLKGKDVEIRFVSFPIPADIAIYNGNRAHIALFSNRKSTMQNEVAALTSNNPCYVQAIQNYFDILWQNSITIYAYPER